MDELIFFVNGRKVVVKNPDPEINLLSYLRDDLRLTGTKLACGEGGCGACTVMVSRYRHEDETFSHKSVNACLMPLCSLHGLAVTTVEGIGSVKKGLHPVQDRLAKSHGSQCGFCTPGIVMSVYTLLCNNPCPTEANMEKALEGNLCRCTGYRPILEGFRSFTEPVAEQCCRNETNCKSNEHCAVSISNGNINGLSDHEESLTFDSSQKLLSAPISQLHVSNGNINGLTDHEQFLPFDTTQKSLSVPYDQLRLHGKECDGQELLFRSDRVTWHRPTALKDLLVLRNEHPNAKIVIGNSEIGVEVKFKNMHYPVIISATHVDELNTVEHMTTGIRFGASVTLHQLDVVLKEAVKQMDESKTRIFAAILEMLRWFAGQQIRNVAAIGGNIVTASPISDLNPVFLAAGCSVTVASLDGGERTLKMDHEFFTGYRQTKLMPTEVLLYIDIPFTEENEYFFGYKQAQRKEDDIAIVNAGMRVIFENNSSVIADIALSFGGMAPVTVMAPKTADQLKGRNWDDKLVPLATRLLLEELPLAPGTPGGMEAYRCSLSVSFFYKFYLTVRLALERKAPTLFDSRLDTSYHSATEIYTRDASRGVQLYENVPDGQIKVDAVGRPLPHLAAQQQTTGEAVFIDDIPSLKDEASLALVLSTRAHAKILNVDPSEALSMPGVIDYVSYKDIPGVNLFGCEVRDEIVFAVDKVTSYGTIIGAIVADTKVHAQRAAKAVKVEYEDLKPIITIEDAIAAASYMTPPHNPKIPKIVQCGNVDEGFSVADHVLEGEMHVGGQEHFYMETQQALVIPKKEDGETEVFSSCQDPTQLQKDMALVLGVDCNKITIRVKRIGGGFGGKQSRFSLLALPLAVAAAKNNLPIRAIMDRDEDMAITGTRHPYLAKYKVGFTKEGKILALEVTLYQNSGDSLDLSMPVLERSLLHLDNCYKMPNVRLKGYLCRTNTPSNTAFRAFGAPQAMVVCETWMSDVAKTLDLPLNQVRELNMYKEGERTHYNQQIINCTIRRCWDEVLKQSAYPIRKLQVEDFNGKNRWMKRGIAVNPVKYGVGFGFAPLDKSGALVHIYQDGSVFVSFGGVEMGQGINTKMIQVASRVLKIPTSKIYVSECSTGHVPNASATAASMGSDLNGMAVMRACETLIERLRPYMEALPEKRWEDWVFKAYFDRVHLSATGFYMSPDLTYDWATNEGNMYNYYGMGAACSEVEIDCLTGDHKVLRTDIVMDVGKSLNPAVDIGQIEGAFVQGIGLYTIEEERYSTDGYLYTRGPGSYKIPSFANIPIEFNVTLLHEATNPKAVYSSKAIGEPPLFLASSVFFAIKEAIESARSDAGLTGVFRLDSPATSERIRLACADQFTKQIPIAKPGTYVPWFVRL